MNKIKIVKRRSGASRRQVGQVWLNGVRLGGVQELRVIADVKKLGLLEVQIRISTDSKVRTLK